MWPFSRRTIPTKRLNALETTVDDLAHALNRVAGAQKSSLTELHARLDAMDGHLNKLRGVVHGNIAAVQRAEKTVPDKKLDQLTRDELRARAGIVPGRPFKHS